MSQIQANPSNKLKISLLILTFLAVTTVTGVTVFSSQDFVDAFNATAELSDTQQPGTIAHAATNGIDKNSRVLSLVELFENTESGVVSISVQKDSSMMINGEAISFNNNAAGSGFVYDDQGHIITNNHVVRDAQKIVVTFTNGYSYNAEVVGTDTSTDLAVIKIDDVDEASMPNPLSLGQSSKIRVGEQIAAIGNPFGLSGSMTSGIVSQIGRLLPSENSGFSIPDMIQTDAAINPGNSGGPLLNMYGEVIGINTAILSATGEFIGVGFAVPSDTASKIIPSLIESGKYDHPWIGITSRDVDPDLAGILGLQDAKGVMIITIVTDSPADNANLGGSDQTKIIDGIEYQIGGDVIVSVDGKEVRKIEDILIHLQREKSVGDAIELEVVRSGDPGKTETVTVVLGLRPSQLN
ncbi:S1C family serine protease [Nitrosopumilus sp.]|uniref:S1C family serine protease n=1 Tax=Nitrosopumilus sp. TaxID=2024843 RepID=UPI00292E75FA|nr:trypsin-like peptidase domain-containing protein [Nitrosopumilus sp.]